MHWRHLFTLFCLFSIVYTTHGQPSGAELLEKSIAFHDPTGNWPTFKGQLDFVVTRPNKPNGDRTVFIDNKNEHFLFVAKYENGELEYEVDKGSPHTLWNGEESIPEEVAKKYRVTKDRSIMYRNYYTYLYGMPMKLLDPGTQISPEVQEVDFYGKRYYKLKVTYDPQVGKDSWYFYFNTKTYALEAYQFFKDESKNDGEYILFEGLRTIDRIKMPKDRKWYFNKDEKYLATDILK